MADLALHTFPKTERLCSRKALEELFGGGHRSVSAFPIRAVYMPNDVGAVRVMVSVSKRYFKRAVRRNRIKRQLREAYRLQKELLQPLSGGLDIAFLWTSDELLPTEKVFQKMQNLLQRIHESVSADT
ncbi:MAG: ribonuclease P protein component [Bacteroidaceae bacterium]|nr:ribonuclease P protein component [Bacteroidaceae bacterium]MBQ9295064.1 ribonuclease P protein component [Bacteroidaceae bacterium]